MSWRLKRTKHLIVLAVSLAVAFVTTARADILHVPGDFPTIQAAIDAAMDGDEVEVHPGTYNETINLLGKAITVRSSDGAGVTTIDGTGLGDSVVKCLSGEEPDTILDGFTITGGSALLGGGMLNVNSSPTVTNCTFSENSAIVGGGGMLNMEGSSPTIINCVITRNTVDKFFGGGIAIAIEGTALLIDCIISDNAVPLGIGGGIAVGSTSILIVTNCQIIGNVAGRRGGGIYFEPGTATISNSTILGNSAIDGGGMFNFAGSSPTISNCTFSGNLATEGNGGAIYNDAGSPTVSNSTFNGNLAAGDGGGIYSRTVGSHPRLDNCILWANSGGEIIDANGAMTTVSYTDVHGGWPGTGNIDVDPMFVDPDNGDFRLSSGSPCIDAGNNWGVPVDEFDYDEDGVLCELFPVDLDGNPRFNADEADFDPGCGVPVVVDMGAYEYQFDPVENVVFADLNADGAVGVADLLGLLASWGPCAKGCCLADLDIDDNVGVSDLLALLANWGPCP